MEKEFYNEYVSQNAVPNGQSESIDNQISSASEIIPYLVLNEKDISVNAKATAEAAGLLYVDGWFCSKNGIKICQTAVVEKLVEICKNEENDSDEDTILINYDNDKSEIIDWKTPELEEISEDEETEMLVERPIDNYPPEDNESEVITNDQINYRKGKYDLLKYALENFFKDNCEEKGNGKALQYYLKDWAKVDGNNNITFKGMKKSLHWWCATLNVYGSPCYTPNNNSAICKTTEQKKLRKGKYDLLKFALENFFEENCESEGKGKELQYYLKDWAKVDGNNNITFKGMKKSLRWWCVSLDVYGSPYYTPKKIRGTKKVSALENLLLTKESRLKGMS